MISAISLLTALAVFATIFHIERFKSITDFWIANRLTRQTCSVPWDQIVPVCSDALADFTELSFMRPFAAEIQVSLWSDLALRDIALVPQRCRAFRVRHSVPASGIQTDPQRVTQTIWLTDGGVYTVATGGLEVGDALTLCVGTVNGHGPLRLTSRLADGRHVHYIGTFVMPFPGHRFWWQPSSLLR